MKSDSENCQCTLDHLLNVRGFKIVVFKYKTSHFLNCFFYHNIVYKKNQMFTITITVHNCTLRIPVLHQSQLSRGSQWKIKINPNSNILYTHLILHFIIIYTSTRYNYYHVLALWWSILDTFIFFNLCPVWFILMRISIAIFSFVAWEEYNIHNLTKFINEIII